MSDFVTSFIRTVVPTLVGSLIGWLITLGITLPEHAAQSLTAGVIALSIALYYLGARWLERRWPAFGYLLGTRAEPTYAGTAPDGAHVITGVPELTDNEFVRLAASAVGPDGWTDLTTLAAALDEGDPARQALVQIGFDPAATRQEYHGRD